MQRKSTLVEEEDLKEEKEWQLFQHAVVDASKMI